MDMLPSVIYERNGPDRKTKRENISVRKCNSPPPTSPPTGGGGSGLLRGGGNRKYLVTTS